MRLLKIGRDASCDIVLHSDKVSSYHAEITLLNSGDILLEDKNSKNGTFLMNKPVKPGTPVSIRRGDALRFADVELLWSQVPMPEDTSAYKGLFGIGSNFRNEIQITGNTVSRFHATLKLGKDGKTYIQDHSKNGTTVNGTRIGFGQNVRIKRNDAIVCGGVPVDIKRFIPSSSWPKFIAVVAIAALVVGAIFLIKPLMSSKPSLNALESATACVIGNYYIVATIEDDPFKEELSELGWPQEWVFGMSGQNYPVLQTMTNNSVSPITYYGTAFFISDNGDLGTNRHMVVPWEYLNYNKSGTENKIRQILAELRNDFVPVNELKTNQQLAELYSGGVLGQIICNYLGSGSGITKNKLSQVNGWISRFKNSKINISGRIEGIDIALKGQNLTYTREFLPCHVIAESGDKEIDVAILRLNTKETPAKIVKNGYYDINKARLDEKKLRPQQEDLITIGYPYGLMMGLYTEKNALKPTLHKLSVSKEPDHIKFQFQGEELGGASGSPIIDSREHRLVGVLYGGYAVGSTFGLACNIKHLKELYDKHKDK